MLPIFSRSSKNAKRANPGTRFGLKRVLPLVPALLLLSGCALRGPAFPPEKLPTDIPPTAYLESVPFIAQKAYQCGPAATAMVLQWSGLDVSADQLVPMVYIPERKGSLQTGIIGAARRHGRLAYPVEGPDALLKEIAAGHPVIVLQNLGLSWIPRWHYAVAVGYDLNNHRIILHTGDIAGRHVGLDTFGRTWRRADYWGLLLLPVGTMPADVQVLPYLKAVLGLEQAGQLPQAIRAYRAAAVQWPHDSGVQMALGNALYASGELNLSRDAFASAVKADPQNGLALNNLAHVLAQLKQWDAAEDAAQRAVAAGGPRLNVFEQTLKEIRAQRSLQ